MPIKKGLMMEANDQTAEPRASGTPVEGAVALVTGGFRGFGAALVGELLARGAAKVYATSRTEHNSPDPRVVPLVLDVTDVGSVAGAAATATDISILVNNAGIALDTPLLTASYDSLHAEIDTNCFGMVRMVRAFSSVLAAHPPSSILNVLSVLSWLAVGKGYEVSKAAAWSATNSLRDALREQGTTVTALHVAYMDTDLVSHLEVEKADPRDIARLAVDGIVHGAPEVLADDVTRWIKSQLGVEVAA